MDLRGYMDAVRRRWLVVLACALVLGFLAVGASRLIASPGVTAASSPKSELLVDVGALPGAGDWVQAGARLTSTIAQLASSASVLEAVLEQIGSDESIGELREQLVIEVPTNSNLIRITARTDDGAALVNAIAEQTIRLVPPLLPQVDGVPAASLTLVSAASDRAVSVTGSAASARSTVVVGVAGGLLGLVLGVVVAIATEVVVVRSRDRARLAAELGIPTAVTSGGPSDARGLVALRHHVLAVSEGDKVRVVVTPATGADDELGLAPALAASFAATGRTVGLVVLEDAGEVGPAPDGVEVVTVHGAASDAVQRAGDEAFDGLGASRDVVIVACPTPGSDAAAALLSASGLPLVLVASKGAAPRAIEAAADGAGELGGAVAILVDVRA